MLRILFLLLTQCDAIAAPVGTVFHRCFTALIPCSSYALIFVQIMHESTSSNLIYTATSYSSLSFEIPAQTYLQR